MPRYNAQQYKLARPTYPKELFEIVYSYHNQKSNAFDFAVDVGTGTGQTANALKSKFNKVTGVDISKEMLEMAAATSGVDFEEATAEDFASKFAPESVDMITASTAAHWFDMPAFYEQCKKALKPNGTIAIWAYGHFVCPSNPEITRSTLVYSMETLEPYWDPRRQFLDNMYSDPDFVNPKGLSKFERRVYPDNDGFPVLMKEKWSLGKIREYYRSWSPYKSFLERHAGEEFVDPVESEISKLMAILGTNDLAYELEIYWPIVLLLATK